MAPQKIICIGLNYRRHADEAKMVIPDTPSVFGKFANTLIGDGAVVTIPAVTHQADYEVELAVDYRPAGHRGHRRGSPGTCPRLRDRQ